jgi:small GTP-binding protein
MSGGTDELREYRKKVCLLGEFAVGKTSLVRRYVNNIFDDLYILTIGVKVTSKEIVMRDKGAKFTFAIWDIGGHLEPSDVPETYYINTAGAIIVCDVTRRETLDRCKDWVEMLYGENNKEDLTLIFAANKCDEDATFSEDEIKAMAESYNGAYFMTSAKNGQNVENAFMLLAKQMLERK